jgi:hypothetical protein
VPNWVQGIFLKAETDPASLLFDLPANEANPGGNLLRELVLKLRRERADRGFTAVFGELTDGLAER